MCFITLSLSYFAYEILSLQIYLVGLSILFVLSYRLHRLLNHNVIAKWFYLFCPILLPVIGSLFSLVLYFLFETTKADQRIDNEDEKNYYLSGFEQSIVTKKMMVQSKIPLQNKKFTDHLVPYLDILQGNDLELKVDTCIKLANYDDGNSVKLLKKALKDEVYDVRYMANNALEKIEKRILLELEQINSLLRLNPNDLETLMKRAETLTRYCNTGLLDRSVAANFFRKALQDFKVVYESSENKTYPALRYAYTCAILDYQEELERVCLDLLEQKLSINDRNKFLFYLMELRFKQKKYIEVAKISRELEMTQISYEKISNSINFWREIHV